MYSYEDRIRAVRLYIELGKRTGPTIRQLGYPTKNALKSWHRKYEQGRDLPVGYARSKPKYSDEQKKVAVRHYLDNGCCLAAIVKALRYPCLEALAAWVDALHPETSKRVAGKARSVPRLQALKQMAVIELCTRQTSEREIAQKLAMSRGALYKWKNQLLAPEAPASVKPNNDLPPDPERAELERQVQSLRRDSRKLQLEHDILKKASVGSTGQRNTYCKFSAWRFKS